MIAPSSGGLSRMLSRDIILVAVLAYSVVFSFETRRMKVIEFGLVEIPSFDVCASRALVVESLENRASAHVLMPDAPVSLVAPAAAPDEEAPD